MTNTKSTPSTIPVDLHDSMLASANVAQRGTVEARKQMQLALDGSAPSWARALAEADIALKALSYLRMQLASAAHLDGLTLEEIGVALGITKQGAAHIIATERGGS